jgi:hypothetical protein
MFYTYLDSFFLAKLENLILLGCLFLPMDMVVK